MGTLWRKREKRRMELGWETGIEPATFGATDRRSTAELLPAVDLVSIFERFTFYPRIGTRA